MEIGQEAVPKLVVLLGFFAADKGATGAKAVGEGIEAHGGLTLRSLWTRRLLRVLAVGFVLFVGN
jgi:hypothetical protein